MGRSSFDAARFCLTPDRTVRDAIACIDRNGEGIALVVDEERRLLATVTDGDVRRAILGGTIDLDATIGELLADAARVAPRAEPLTAPAGTPDADLLRLLNENAFRHIPLLNEAGQVVDIALLRDLVQEYELPLRAVVMAGGMGTRLLPLTERTPKPLLPVGDRPLMQRIIEQLRASGIRRVNVAVHHQREQITGHFGDGRDLGVEIRYVTEDRPLGTAGALRLMEQSSEPLLVVNGDILTAVDFGTLLAYHREHRADVTVGVRKHEITVPYGVIECDGPYVHSLVEKPSLPVLINAGMYLLEPDALEFIPADLPFDMTDLISRLLDAGRRVISFPIHEYWRDIGQPDEYQLAQEDDASGRLPS